MNGMFSNSRGLGDLAKHLFFADSIQEHNLDFLAISEMGRRDFAQSFLDRLSGGLNFVWHSRPPRGRSGGILVGIKTDTMEVLACSDGDFHVKLHIQNKLDNFTWSLVTAYGAAQEEFKADFLREMVNLAKDNPYPILTGGISICLDFHLRRVKAGLMIIGHSYSMLLLTA
jgi:hypothetical protein